MVSVERKTTSFSRVLALVVAQIERNSSCAVGRRATIAACTRGSSPSREGPSITNTAVGAVFNAYFFCTVRFPLVTMHPCNQSSQSASKNCGGERPRATDRHVKSVPPQPFGQALRELGHE